MIKRRRNPQKNPGLFLASYDTHNAINAGFRRFALQYWAWCQWCGVWLHRPGRVITADHVVHRSQGGKDVWSNLVLSCWPCNYARGCEPSRRLPMGPKWPDVPESVSLGTWTGGGQWCLWHVHDGTARQVRTGSADRLLAGMQLDQEKAGGAWYVVPVGLTVASPSLTLVPEPWLMKQLNPEA